MATTVPIPSWKLFYRVAPETAFSTNAVSDEWNIGGNGGGAKGYRDVALSVDQSPIVFQNNQIFQQYASGKRAMNQQAPVEGAYTVEHSLEMPLYLELVDPFIHALMGSTVRTPTAGAAALASTAFASVASLDTEPDSDFEQLKFVIASSTAAAAASINIIQGAVTVETITIGTSATSVDGDYYSKGAYGPTAGAVTFTVAGTVTAGTVVISGIDLNTNVSTLGTSAPPTLQLEEGGRPGSGSSSFFYAGVTVPSMTFAFDRTAADGMVTVSADIASEYPSVATATSYLNDAKTYYHPLQGWTASITKDAASFDKLSAATFTISNNNTLFAIASGNQQPSGVFAGGAELTGTFTVLSEDNVEFAAFDAQSVADYELTFTSPQNIVDSTKWSLKFEFSETYFETLTTNQSDGLLSTDLAIRTTDDSADGIVKITNVNRMPV
jgi:hypothetical protein